MIKALSIVVVVCVAFGSSFSGTVQTFNAYQTVLSDALQTVSVFFPSISFKSKDPYVSDLNQDPYFVGFDRDNPNDYTIFINMYNEISSQIYPRPSSSEGLVNGFFPEIITTYYGNLWKIDSVSWYPTIYRINGDFVNNPSLECVRCRVRYSYLLDSPIPLLHTLLAKGDKTIDFYFPIRENTRMEFTLPNGDTDIVMTTVYTLDGGILTSYVWGYSDGYDYSQNRTYNALFSTDTDILIKEYFSNDN